MAPPRSKKLKLQPADAASGADTINTATKTNWSLMKLLEIESPLEIHRKVVADWFRDIKSRVDAALLQFLRQHNVDMEIPVPTDVMSIPPLAIRASGAKNLSAFREAMHFDNLHVALRGTGQYESAGTIWMLDPCKDDFTDENVTFAQIEAASWQWAEDAFVQSSSDPAMRRYGFPAPLPARMLEPDRAQLQRTDTGGVVMPSPLSMIATEGRSVSLSPNFPPNCRPSQSVHP